jgi:RNA polymerase primary sigma factor
MKQLKITKQITRRESLALEKYLQEISVIPLLTPEEEVELAKRIHADPDDEDAVDVLVSSNLRFVVSVTKQYTGQGMTLRDLISHGNMGLIKAARRFNPTLGFKFISYAVWWIRQSILQSLAEDSRVMRVPLNRIGMLNRILKYISAFEQQHERRPTDEEIGNKLGVSAKEVRLTLQISGRHLSMDNPFIEGEENTLADVLIDKVEGTPNEQLMNESLRREIQELVGSLNERQARVISLYFGLENNVPITLEEIGKKLDLTRERVRQIKEKGLIALRNKAWYKKLNTYLGT